MKGTAQSNLIGGWEIDLETSGLSRRDYFAAMAMQGLLARIAPSTTYTDITARRAVAFADAVIAELDKEAE